MFRYRTSRHYYRLALEGGTRLRLAVRLPFDEQFRVAPGGSWRARRSPYDTKTWYRLEASAEGRSAARVRRRQAAHRRARRRADRRASPASPRTCPRASGLPRDRHGRGRRRPAPADRARASASSSGCAPENPQPKLWQKFDTPDFGAGRNVRFGDLDGDGRLDMLFAQNVPKVRGDAFDHISCLTAVTLDGKVLWQQGRPNPKNGLLTNDTPFQIHDLDGDGRTEVVLARDFQLQVLDGRTGKLLRSAWLPQIAAGDQGSPVRAQHRRLAAVRRSQRRAARRARSCSKDRYRGVLDLRQGPEAALGRAGADRALSVSRSTSTATAGRSS